MNLGNIAADLLEGKKITDQQEGVIKNIVREATNKVENALQHGFLEMMLDKCDQETKAERNIKKWWSTNLPKVDLNELLKVANASYEVGIETSLNDKSIDYRRVQSLLLKLGQLLLQRGINEPVIIIQIKLGYGHGETQGFLKLLKRLCIPAQIEHSFRS